MMLDIARPLAARPALAALDWDGLIASAPNGHVLQSERWGAFKARYGWEPERLVMRTASGVAAAQVLWRRTPLGTVGYVPRGPALMGDGDDQASTDLMHALHHRARARGAFFLKVEPNATNADALMRHGFRPSAQTVQPKATLVVDLRDGLEAVAARQHPKTRYNIRLAAKKGVTVRVAGRQDLPAFHALMELTGRRDGFTVRPLTYYDQLLRMLGDQAELLVAEHDGDLLAALLVTYFGDEALYLYGASSDHKRNLMATYLLQWEAMRRAYGRGCSRYDLWGIPSDVALYPTGAGEELPPPQDHQRGDLWGVYRFKRGFGGRLVSYSGALDCVYRPLNFWVWTNVIPRVQWLIRRRSAGAD